MHFNCYVLVPTSKVSTSLEARQYVFDDLTNDHTFCQDDEARFCDPLCDWLVIGGRWSGMLRPRSVRDEFWEQVRKLEDPAEDNCLCTKPLVTKNRKELDAFWTRLGGKYDDPIARDQYRALGEEDDACLLEGWLVDELNAYLHSAEQRENYYFRGYEGVWRETGAVVSTDDEIYSLEDFNEIARKYWVVIIDCHM